MSPVWICCWLKTILPSPDEHLPGAIPRLLQLLGSAATAVDEVWTQQCNQRVQVTANARSNSID